MKVQEDFLGPPNNSDNQSKQGSGINTIKYHTCPRILKCGTGHRGYPGKGIMEDDCHLGFIMHLLMYGP